MKEKAQGSILYIESTEENERNLVAKFHNFVLQGKRQEIIALANDTIKGNANNHGIKTICYLALGRAYESSEDLVLAGEYYKKSLESSNTTSSCSTTNKFHAEIYTEASISYGDLLIKMGRHDDAIAVYEKCANYEYNNDIKIKLIGAYINSSKYEKAIDLCDLLLANQSQDNEQTPYILIERGKAYQLLNNHAEAIESFKRVLDIDKGKSVSAWNNLGVSYLALQKLNDAFSCFHQAIVQDPLCSLAYRNKALLFSQHYGESKNAIEVCKGGLNKIGFNDPVINSTLGDIYYSMDNRQMAMFHYDIVLRKNPDNFDALMGKAHILCINGDKDGLQDAIKIYNKLLKIYPQDLDIYMHLGYIYMISEQPDQALEHYSKAIKISPESGEIWNAIGKVKEIKHDYNEAIDCYTSAAYCSNDSLYFCNLGNVFLKLCKYKEALKAFKEAQKHLSAGETRDVGKYILKSIDQENGIVPLIVKVGFQIAETANMVEQIPSNNPNKLLASTDLTNGKNNLEAILKEIQKLKYDNVAMKALLKKQQKDLINTKASVIAIESDHKKTQGTLTLAKVAEKAEIAEKLKILQDKSPEAHAFCCALGSAINSHITAAGVLSTGQVGYNTNLTLGQKAGTLGVSFAVGAGASLIPIISALAPIISSTTQKAIEYYYTKKEIKKAGSHASEINNIWYQIPEEERQLCIMKICLTIAEERMEKTGGWLIKHNPSFMNKVSQQVDEQINKIGHKITNTSKVSINTLVEEAIKSAALVIAFWIANCHESPDASFIAASTCSAIQNNQIPGLFGETPQGSQQPQNGKCCDIFSVHQIKYDNNSIELAMRTDIVAPLIKLGYSLSEILEILDLSNLSGAVENPNYIQE